MRVEQKKITPLKFTQPFFRCSLLSTIKKCDKNIIINSEALNTILKFDWGIGTVIINGRFYVNNNSYLNNLRSAFSIPLLNSNGITLIKYNLNKILNKKNNIDEYRPEFKN